MQEAVSNWAQRQHEEVRRRREKRRERYHAKKKLLNDRPIIKEKPTGPRKQKISDQEKWTLVASIRLRQLYFRRAVAVRHGIEWDQAAGRRYSKTEWDTDGPVDRASNMPNRLRHPSDRFTASSRTPRQAFQCDDGDVADWSASFDGVIRAIEDWISESE